jgi:hypothetical protein
MAGKKHEKLTPELAQKLNSFVRTPSVLPKLTTLDGTNQTGVAVNAYGLGQLSGVFFTAPAHGLTRIGPIEIKMFCMTPADVTTLSNLIRSLLDASH